MPNGLFSLMMTSLKRGYMALSLRVAMGLHGGSILEYLPILRTILRSKPYFFIHKNGDKFDKFGSLPRILLASIRNMGHCPCPRCRVPLSHAHNVGTDTDMQHRVALARVDDQSRQGAVSAARKLVYDKHYQVTSSAVENYLKETSLVPNVVCTSVPYHSLHETDASEYRTLSHID